MSVVLDELKQLKPQPPSESTIQAGTAPLHILRERAWKHTNGLAL